MSAPVTIVAHHVGTAGGMESQLGRVVSGLLERGYEVTVIARACAVAPHPRLRFIRVPGPERPFSLRFAWFFVAGSVAARRHRRGVLHTTGALVANRADVCTVHFCHRAFAQTGLSRADRSSAPYRLNSALTAWLSRTAEALAYRPGHTRRLVGVSLGVGDELRHLFPDMGEAVSSIPNGVDLERYRPDPVAREQVRAEIGATSDELVAAFVGSEWERKGLRHAIEALAGAPRWSLLVAGSGDERRFRGLAEAAGAASRVRFLGLRDDAPRLLAASDAFLLPTAYETFSLATFEAAASGLALLNTRVHGVQELLQDGVNGWFVERDGTDIARRLRQLEDPELRTRMGAQAREASASFGWEPVVDAYAALYERLAMAP